MASNQISLNPNSIARVLAAVAFLLVVASTGWQIAAYMTGHEYIYGLVPLFYLDAEQNIPTFFSSFLLLFAALLLLVITVLERNQAAARVSHWAVLSCGFFFMAIDEFISLHERLMEPTRRLLGGGDLGIFCFAWVIPGIALILVLAPFFVKFLWRLPAKTRLTFVVAAIIYIGGCIGFDIIGGAYASGYGTHNLTYSMIATVEESLEMAGVIIFIRGLLVYICDNYKEVRFRIEGTSGQAKSGEP